MIHYMEYPSQKFSFPSDFIWGTGDSAFQVEGALKEDGRGESTWDVFSRIEGKIANGENADIACDRYHRYIEDLDLLAELGVKAHRISISWPRIHPNGDEKINPLGLAYYSKLFDAFEERNIQPWVTLYHWELPQALFTRGGWRNRIGIDEFERYTETVAKEFGHRVKGWIVLNEPFVNAFLGYMLGAHAPGLEDPMACFNVSHNLIVAQGKAIQKLREYSPNSLVGTSVDVSGSSAYPETNSPENIAVVDQMRGFQLHQYLDPLLLRKYTNLKIPGIESIRQSGDLEIMNQQIDFLGINYYNRIIVKHGDSPQTQNMITVKETSGLTEMDWKIAPEALFDILKHLDERYNHPKFVISENGAAFQDVLIKNGVIQDNDRIGYLRDHILEVYHALQTGIDIQGYLVWTLLDNFEWGHGYSKKFGLVHVDRNSLKRTPKKSFQWYKDVIARNGLTLP